MGIVVEDGLALSSASDLDADGVVLTFVRSLLGWLRHFDNWEEYWADVQM